MLQYPPHSSPFVFSDGRKKSSSSTSNPRFLSNGSSKFNPHRLAPPVPSMIQRGSVDTDLSQDRSSFVSGLSHSTSFSSLPSPSFPSSSLPQAVPRPSHASSRARSTISSHVEDILSPGDVVGEGIPLQGELLRLVPNQSAEQAPVADYQELAPEFQVVSKLGTGSYAIVYLVREVLSRSPPSEDDHVYPGGRLEFDDAVSMRSTEYGREYAIKLLSKADLDEEELFAQLTEATIHQSVPVHSNIVTLHRTLETSSFLLLLLEYVPGQDLFYFLEQARDHYDVDHAADPALTHTPPTPGLLSSLHPSQLLSHTRLRLIASMFAQMCEAVATCHDASVFHRDIKPENFIVTDGWVFNQDGTIRERKVIVKLSDFGLSTRDAVSSDMDCGSAPYMSYECRNNVAPVYKPRAADVWSLGIVLINMLYHCNPWVDTVKDGFSSFDQYLLNPTNFMRRFAGMTLPVANFLVDNVFCILDDPTDDSQRIGAREFGVWIRDLPTLMAASQPATHIHSRVPSTTSVATGHPIASAPASRRPSSRQPSVAGGSPRRPPVVLRSLTRNTSMGSVIDRDGSDGAVLPALDLVLDEEDEEDQQQQQPQEEGQHEAEVRSPSPSQRSNSNTKRRKRGRKGKGMTPSIDLIQTSELLASASQTLARELSRQTRSTSATLQSFPDVPPPPPVPVPVSVPTVTKKPSRWKLSFGKSGGEAALSTRSDSQSSQSVSNRGSARSVHVSNLIMGLNSPPVPISPPAQLPPAPPSVMGIPTRARGEPQPQSRRAASPTSMRSGRGVSSSSASSNWRNSMASTNTSTSAFTRYSNQSMRSVATFATSVSASSASSSTNWRKQSGSAFPSTTSLASSLNSNNGSQISQSSGLPRRPPTNIKPMTGVPWELSGAPRQLHQKDMDIFGSAPVPRERKRAGRGGGKGKQPTTGTAGKSALEPINERFQQHQSQCRQDAATSTTDLTSQVGAGHGQGPGDSGDSPKAGKAQNNNALAKMISALRR